MAKHGGGQVTGDLLEDQCLGIDSKSWFPTRTFESNHGGSEGQRNERSGAV